ncbi:nucleoside recognition domain-containing protein [Symbiobacterium thermophilum]|nr:nucleoside recognition domain-containing protein [Symbiobacterium thermophilum]
MMWLWWLWEGLLTGVRQVAGLWWLILLFIGIQILKDAGWLGRASRYMAPVLRPLRLPGEAGVPMAAGLGIGLTYGAGVLIQTAREGRLTRDELTVMCVFLGICHAIFEETVLFAAAGANGLLLLAIRLAAAALFGWLAARAWLRPTEQASPVPDEVRTR